jgi:hypothetical protein
MNLFIYFEIVINIIINYFIYFIHFIDSINLNDIR